MWSDLRFLNQGYTPVPTADKIHALPEPCITHVVTILCLLTVSMKTIYLTESKPLLKL